MDLCLYFKYSLTVGVRLACVSTVPALKGVTIFLWLKSFKKFKIWLQGLAHQCPSSPIQFFFSEFHYFSFRHVISIKTFLPRDPLPPQSPSTLHSVKAPLQDISRVRVLCLIVTAPQHHQDRARHVKLTWAKHCDRAVFVSSEADPTLGQVIAVPQAVSYNQLWDKVTAGKDLCK